MPNASLQQEVTRLIQAAGTPDAAAAEQLLAVVYDQLRKLAQQRMNAERRDHTLQATALVHEAYVRLMGDQPVAWANRAHFFAAAAEAMRRILVERARQRAAAKHGGGRRRNELSTQMAADPDRAEQVLAISEALERLAAEDPRKAELVKLRYFAGLTLAETAEALGISLATAERYWTYSRVRLFQWLRD